MAITDYQCYYLDAMQPDQAVKISARFPEQAAEVYCRLTEESCGVRDPVPHRVVMVEAAGVWRTYYVSAIWHLKYEATDADEYDPDQPF